MNPFREPLAYLAVAVGTVAVLLAWFAQNNDATHVGAVIGVVAAGLMVIAGFRGGAASVHREYRNAMDMRVRRVTEALPAFANETVQQVRYAVTTPGVDATYVAAADVSVQAAVAVATGLKNTAAGARKHRKATAAAEEALGLLTPLTGQLRQAHTSEVERVERLAVAARDGALETIRRSAQVHAVALHQQEQQEYAERLAAARAEAARRETERLEAERRVAAQREQAAREQAARDQEAHRQRMEAQEHAERERVAQVLAAREQQVREQRAREQVAREAAARSAAPPPAPPPPATKPVPEPVTTGPGWGTSVSFDDLFDEGDG
jgi:cytochrome c biogenesis factor